MSWAASVKIDYNIHKRNLGLDFESLVYERLVQVWRRSFFFLFLNSRSGCWFNSPEHSY